MEITTDELKKNNCFKFVDLNNNTIVMDEKTQNKIKMVFSDSASNNYISVEGTTTTEGIIITLFGNNGTVVMGKSSYHKAVVNCGGHAKITVGDDCMSSNIFLMQSDQHMIFDINSKKCINMKKDIVIGNHVWLGRESMILGGGEIPDGCIVGARTTTSHKFKEKNSVIAGNPGKIIRRNIIWARDSVENHFDSYEMCKDLSGQKYI